jgi:hypothetical protein
MDIDVIINVIANTILSPTFCAFIPVSFYGQVRSFWQSTVYISTAWTALIIAIGESLISDPIFGLYADMHSRTSTHQSDLYQPIIMAAITLQAGLEQADRVDNRR